MTAQERHERQVALVRASLVVKPAPPGRPLAWRLVIERATAIRR